MAKRKVKVCPVGLVTRVAKISHAASRALNLRRHRTAEGAHAAHMAVSIMWTATKAVHDGNCALARQSTLKALKRLRDFRKAE